VLDALAAPFVQNAVAAGAIVAAIAAVAGVFIVLRGMAFAAHALAQIGFAGAAGAVLIGVDPLIGLVAFSVAGAGLVGRLDDRGRQSDVTVALVLVAALGLGALFLVLTDSFASEAFELLFGTIVGVSRRQVWETLVLSVVAAILLAVVARPLAFATIAPDAARARGLRTGRVGTLFLVIVAIVAAVTTPTVGTLLIYSLLIGPAAAATRLTSRLRDTMLLAVAFGEIASLGGIAAAYATGWPVGFFISAFATAEYAGARLLSARSEART